MHGDQWLDYAEKRGHALYKATAHWRVSVPYGRAGPWQVKPFDVQYDLQYLRHARDGRDPGIGRFTQLVHDRRGTVMSDTAAEIADAAPYMDQLRGHVLVTGLGLGMIPQYLIRKFKAHHILKSITIIEKDPDVITLSGMHYCAMDPRIRVIQADAYRWKPRGGFKFDVAWHDIWDNICSDNAKEFAKMRAHYKPHMRTKRSKQFCWGEKAMKELCS